MGMYDTIRKIAFPLPESDAWERSAEYQTKDFACELDEYEIDAEGLLWKTKAGFADLPGHERQTVPVPYTGKVIVYAGLRNETKQSCERWTEWEILFVHGKARWVRLCRREIEGKTVYPAKENDMVAGSNANMMIGDAIGHLGRAQVSLLIVGRSSAAGETVFWGLDSEAMRSCNDVHKQIGSLIEQLGRCLQADFMGTLPKR